MARVKSIARRMRRSGSFIPKGYKIQEYISEYYCDPILDGCEPIWKKRLVLI